MYFHEEAVDSSDYYFGLFDNCFGSVSVDLLDHNIVVVVAEVVVGIVVDIDYFDFEVGCELYYFEYNFVDLVVFVDYERVVVVDMVVIGDI